MMCVSRILKVAPCVVALAGLAGMGVQEAKAWPWPWVNPQIYNSGTQFGGMSYDPFSGNVQLQTNQMRVRESYLDPNRGFHDPGSSKTVNKPVYGSNGQIIGWEHGLQWTTNGVPHGDVTRTTNTPTGIPGVTQEHNDRVLFSNPSKNSSKGGSFLEDR
jgi:hypothetical protein